MSDKLFQLSDKGVKYVNELSELTGMSIHEIIFEISKYLKEALNQIHDKQQKA